MTEDFATRLAAVDARALAPLVAQALDQPEVELLNWGYEALGGGFGHLAGVSGLYRFSGRARAGAEVLPWALVLKAFARASGVNSSPDPATWYYWKREALFYQSGLAADLPIGLAAPRCYGVIEYSEEEIWVWLEAVREATNRVWPLSHYGIVARHLGQFNGVYLAGRPMPTQPWLTRGRWHDWEAFAAPFFSDLRTWCQHPAAQRTLPEPNVQRMAALWSKRDELMQALLQLPRCFCHNDAFRRNLFSRHNADGDWQTVAIDWAFTGSSSVGEEIARLVMGNLVSLEVSVEQAAALDATVFAGYLAGLQTAGWRGDRSIARLGYTIAIALVGMEFLCIALQGMHSNTPPEIVERIFGHPLDQVEKQHAGMFAFALDLADEAQALLKEYAKGDSAMATEMTRTADPLAVVQAFDAACEANDVDRVMEFFADDAVVTLLPPLPPDPGIYSGKQQIRASQEQLLQQFRAVIRNRAVAGDRVTWEATVWSDFFRRMGLASIEDTVEAVVQDGKITSFTVTIAPESARQMEAAMRQASLNQS
jgi:ketosteroid isomerase-like protein